jgi:hypothetical protein
MTWSLLALLACARAETSRVELPKGAPPPPPVHAKRTPKEACEHLSQTTMSSLLAQCDAVALKIVRDDDFGRKMAVDLHFAYDEKKELEKLRSGPLGWQGCVAVASGGWALLIEGLRLEEAKSGDRGSVSLATGTWSVGYEGIDGSEARYVPTNEGFEYEPSEMPKLPLSSCRQNISVSTGADTMNAKLDTTFDFDGDGIDEILFTRSFYRPWQSEQAVGILLTKTRDGITRYRDTPSSIFAMKDMNGDGRPDLLLHESPTEVCNPDHPEGRCDREWGPVTVRRSNKDGSFTADTALSELADKAAKASE